MHICFVSLKFRTLFLEGEERRSRLRVENDQLQTLFPSLFLPFFPEKDFGLMTAAPSLYPNRSRGQRINCEDAAAFLEVDDETRCWTLPRSSLTSLQIAPLSSADRLVDVEARNSKGEALKLATATTKTKINQRSRAGRVARFDLPLFGTPLLPPSGSNLQPQTCQCFNRPSLVFDSISSLRKSESSFRSRRTGLPSPSSPLRRGCFFPSGIIFRSPAISC